eukprot:5709956-Amphidinium_carterae.1
MSCTILRIDEELCESVPHKSPSLPYKCCAVKAIEGNCSRKVHGASTSFRTQSRQPKQTHKKATPSLPSKE